jgi:hypothetical protein
VAVFHRTPQIVVLYIDKLTGQALASFYVAFWIMDLVARHLAAVWKFDWAELARTLSPAGTVKPNQIGRVAANFVVFPMDGSERI